MSTAEAAMSVEALSDKSSLFFRLEHADNAVELLKQSVVVEIVAFEEEIEKSFELRFFSLPGMRLNGFSAKFKRFGAVQ